MRWSRMRVPATVIVVALAVGAFASHAVAGDNEGRGKGNKVTICHRTNSDKKPYVEISVGAKGALHGHAKHHAAKAVWSPGMKAKRQKWGDIVPAFDVGGKRVDGLNLDTNGGADGETSGQSILDDHCAIG